MEESLDMDYWGFSFRNIDLVLKIEPALLQLFPFSGRAYDLRNIVEP